MAVPQLKPATYDDILALPREVTGQIIAGELFVMPRPAFGHAGAASTIGMDLGSAFQRGRGGPGGWWIFDEPELHLGGDIVVPDLAGWRKERMPERPPSGTPYLTLAPDWVCEVVSPSSVSLDRVKKPVVYARESVSHFWVIEPLARTLEAYQLEGGRWVRLGAWSGTDVVRVPPFDAVELELEGWWSP